MGRSNIAGLQGINTTLTGGVLYSPDTQVLDTAGPGTITPAMVYAGAVARDTGGSGRSDTLPTAASLVAYTGNVPTLVTNYQSVTCLYINTGNAGTITLLANTGTTIQGSPTIPTGEQRLLTFTRLSDTAVRCTVTVPLTQTSQSFSSPTFTGTVTQSQTVNARVVAAPATITTAGAGTYLAANLATGMILRDPNGGSRVDTTDTATNIIAAFPSLASTGAYIDVPVKNTADAAETITLAGGVGVNLTSTSVAIPRYGSGVLRFWYVDATHLDLQVMQ